MTRPVVIGLAGGVGAGKSAVASAFASLGCLVADSDAQARAALQRPEVVRTLVEWWGKSVLDADGGVDRSRVASIVFERPEERRRLEGLIHPLVRETRGALIDRASTEGAPAVIVDAPLLFEAGLDSECDAVVFVSAPREVRLARVARSRGWDARELDRREAAQWPVEKKRAACGYEIDNGAETEAQAGAQVDMGVGERLRAEAARVLSAVRAAVDGGEGVGGSPA